MKYFLYMISGPSQKLYIGITKNPKERWKDHRKSKRDHPLYRAMKFYGRDLFSMRILEEFETLEECKAAEVRAIEFFNTQHRDYGYNNSAGGDYDAISGPIALREKLKTNEDFARAYSLSCSRQAKKQWANMPPARKSAIHSQISQTLKSRCENDPNFADLQKQRMLAARAKGDVRERAKAASRGIKQFWIELKENPSRYAAYIEQRKQTLLKTLEAKKNA